LAVSKRPRQLRDRAVELLDDPVQRRGRVGRDVALGSHVARLELFNGNIDEREMRQQRMSQADAARRY
jgi:hypothetical protein